MTTRAIWTPNAGAQQLAWERMDVKQLFFGGGRGSGKTGWIIGVALTQWAMYGASARCLILRRQFRDLREIIRQAKEILCDNGLATYNASEHVFYGKGRFKGATL